MELFFPGLVILLVGAVIAFAILPRLGAPTLAVLSLVLLAYGLYSHYTMFQSEYRFSTWQDRLKQYGPFVVIAALILALIFYMAFLFSTKGMPASVIPNVNTVLPPANTATNPVTSLINNTMRAANNVVSNKQVPTGSNTVANLGSILGTPRNQAA